MININGEKSSVQQTESSGFNFIDNSEEIEINYLNSTNDHIQELITFLIKSKKFKKLEKVCAELLKKKIFKELEPQLKYGLALSNINLGKNSETLKLFYELLIKYPNYDYEILFSYFSNIIEYTNWDSVKFKALFKLNSRLSESSSDGALCARLKLALMYCYIGMTEEAAFHYRTVLKTSPDFFFLMFKLSSIYFFNNDIKNIAIIYKEIGDYLKDKIIPDETTNEEKFLENVNKCISYYIESHKIIPDNIEIMLSLSQLYRMIDKHKEALCYVQLALKINDKDYRVYYEGFIAYEEIGDFHTAKDMIRICLMLNITFVKGFNAFGNLMRKEKMYNQAIDLFETALMREPENTQVINNYATCFLEMGNKNKAKEIYLQAYFLNNNLYEVNCNLSTIYRKEYNFDKAIEHVLKAKEIQPTNPQVYNILSSIYMAAGLIDLAIRSCQKSVELDENNSTSLLQLAQCYKYSKNLSSSINICLNLLRINPKFTEAFINYVECHLYSNDWSNFFENSKNINSMAEYHKHINSTTSCLSNLLADYIISDINLKFWVYEMTSNNEVQNAKYIFDEIQTVEDQNIVRLSYKNKSLKIAYLLDDIKEEYTMNLLLLLLSCSNYRSFSNSIIIFESEKKIQSSYNWKNFFDNYTNDKNVYFERFLDLTDIEDPRSKFEFISKQEFDIIVYLEYQCNGFYNNITNKIILQTLANKPGKIQIILPFNGTTRGKGIFDYTILDKLIYDKNYRHLYKEKLIIMESSLFCYNPYNEEALIKKQNEKSFLPTLDLFRNLKEKNIIILANFSESFKIDRELFHSWCCILKRACNSVLVLKFCNELQVSNLKSLASSNEINANRIMFISFEDNKYDSAAYLQFVDLYLDVRTVNGDFEILFCRFLGLPVMCLLNEDNSISSSLSLSILNEYDKAYKFETIAEYEIYIINYLIAGKEHFTSTFELSNNISDNQADDTYQLKSKTLCKETSKYNNNFNILKFANSIETAANRIMNNLQNEENNSEIYV